MRKSENYEKLNDIARECRTEGWNGYNAIPIDLKHIETARKFVRLFPNYAQPECFPLATNGIQLEWNMRSGAYLEIEIKDEETFHLFCCDDKAQIATMEGESKGVEDTVKFVLALLYGKALVY